METRTSETILRLNSWAVKLPVLKTCNKEVMARTRKGVKDIWNAFMLKQARYSTNDIPFCPTTASQTPVGIIIWDEAKAVYNQFISMNKSNFFYPEYVGFYLDDYKFDGPSGIWSCPQKAFDILRHFGGVITPDFSTYQDFPEPLKLFNTFRMRAFGYWLGMNGLSVINNVRWGTPESYRYCFDGIPENSTVAVSTCEGSPHNPADRARFADGLKELTRVLCPKTIIVYGSAKNKYFDELKNEGIKIISFPHRRANIFNLRNCA